MMTPAITAQSCGKSCRKTAYVDLGSYKLHSGSICCDSLENEIISISNTTGFMFHTALNVSVFTH